MSPGETLFLLGQMKPDEPGGVSGYNEGMLGLRATLFMLVPGKTGIVVDKRLEEQLLETSQQVVAQVGKSTDQARHAAAPPPLPVAVSTYML